MKNFNRPPLFSRDIHEKLSNVILAGFLIFVVVALLIKGFAVNFFVGILTTALVYATLVSGYLYPRLRGRRFPRRK